MGGSAPSTGGSAPDPFADSRPYNLHVGTHEDYVKHVLDGGPSELIFMDILTRTNEFLLSHSTMRPKLIVMYSKWGKHRSVAAGGLLSCCLKVDGSWAVTGVHCMMTQWLGPRVHIKNACPACARVTDGAKAEAYRKTVNLWFRAKAR